ncbi:MAG TPA: glycosyltransferase family 4 protein [Terriglobales bacterium]|nr:glycosyltransferase family 4 protein [Terriglobales bacterium]
MRRRRWALVTGEYPPQPGGVGDYTAQLAAALADSGDEVHVLSPGAEFPLRGVSQHPLPDWGRRGRTLASARLNELSRNLPIQILIQYVPHAYSARAVNFGFARWALRWRPSRPWVMFHEVAVAAHAGAGLGRRLLAHSTQVTARQIQTAAARSFVSIPAWGTWLQQLAPGSAQSEWLPVPSNLPVAAHPAAVADLRRKLAPPPQTLIACFSRLDPFTREHVLPVLASLLHRDSGRHALLLGSDGPRLAAEIAARNLELHPRLHAPGYLPASEVACHLAATDLLVQTYGDGISTRRGTAMAALALGCCTLTHAGHNSEAFWQSSDAVALAPLPSLRATAEALLANPDRRREIAAAGRTLYHQRFELSHTVRALQEGVRA